MIAITIAKKGVFTKPTQKLSMPTASFSRVKNNIGEISIVIQAINIPEKMPLIIPKNVKIHDAMATENPKRSGFGEKEIGDYIKKNPQDIIIIFNH